MMKVVDKAVDLLYKRIHELDTLEAHFQQQLTEIERDRDELHELCRQDKALIHDQCVALQELRLQESHLRAQLRAVELSDRDCHVRCGQLEDTVCRLQQRLHELQIHEQRLLELFRHLKVTEKLWPNHSGDHDHLCTSPGQISTQDHCTQRKAADVGKEKEELIKDLQEDMADFDKLSEDQTQAAKKEVNGELALQLQHSVQENLRLWHHVSHQQAQLEVMHSQLSASGEVALDLRQRVDILQDKETALLEQVTFYQSHDVSLQSRVEELERSEEALKVKVSELQHRVNCLLARLVEYDTVGSQMLDTLPLAQKQQLPQTLEACQQRVVVLTRLLEKAQQELYDGNHKQTQAERQQVCDRGYHVNSRTKAAQWQQVRTQLSDNRRVDTSGEDIQCGLCDSDHPQQQSGQQLYEDHRQTQTERQLSMKDRQQYQAKGPQCEEDHQDERREEAAECPGQLFDAHQEQVQRPLCDNHPEQEQRQLPDNVYHRDLVQAETSPQHNKNDERQQEQADRLFPDNDHQKNKSAAFPGQLNDMSPQEDSVEDHGSHLSDNDPTRQHKTDQEDDRRVEVKEGRGQSRDNSHQRLASESDQAQRQPAENGHQKCQVQEDTDTTTSIIKTTEQSGAHCKGGHRMALDTERRTGQRQEQDTGWQHTVDSSKDVVELFEGLEGQQVLLSSQHGKQQSSPQVVVLPCHSQSPLSTHTPPRNRQRGERGPVPEPPRHLRVEMVEGDSVVLAWQPPVLDRQGCSNGARVVGYRIYLNGRVCQQPHNPTLSSTKIEGVRRSRDPARAQQRLAIETLAASGQASSPVHLVMMIQEDAVSTVTNLLPSGAISGTRATQTK